MKFKIVLEESDVIFLSPDIQHHGATSPQIQLQEHQRQLDEPGPLPEPRPVSCFHV